VPARREAGRDRADEAEREREEGVRKIARQRADPVRHEHTRAGGGGRERRDGRTPPPRVGTPGARTTPAPGRSARGPATAPPAIRPGSPPIQKPAAQPPSM